MVIATSPSTGVPCGENIPEADIPSFPEIVFARRYLQAISLSRLLIEARGSHGAGNICNYFLFIFMLFYFVVLSNLASKEKPIICTLCEEECESQSCLALHLMVEHKVKDPNKFFQPTNSASSKDTQNATKKKHRCYMFAYGPTTSF